MMKKKSIFILLLIIILIILILLLVNYYISIPIIQVLAKIDGYLSDFSLRENQNIIVVGNFSKINNTSIANIARIDKNGDIDKNFDQKNLFGNKIILSIQRVYFLKDGQFLLIYNQVENSKHKTVIEKFSSDGNKIAHFEGNSFIANSIEIQDDGKILIGGKIFEIDDTYTFHIFRLNDDLTFDSSFDTTNGFNKQVFDIAYKDSKIYVAGEFSNYKGVQIGRIVRLDLNGQIDNSFNPKVGANSDIFDIEFDENGDIYVAGMFKSFDDIERVCLAKIKNDGQLDINYNPIKSIKSAIEESQNPDFTQSYDFLPQINRIIYDKGRLIITGNFSDINDSNRFKIARISRKGKLDKSFKISLVDILKKAKIQDENSFISGSINKIIKAGDNTFFISIILPSKSLLVKVIVR